MTMDATARDCRAMAQDRLVIRLQLFVLTHDCVPEGGPSDRPVRSSIKLKYEDNPAGGYVALQGLPCARNAPCQPCETPFEMGFDRRPFASNDSVDACVAQRAFRRDLMAPQYTVQFGAQLLGCASALVIEEMRAELAAMQRKASKACDKSRSLHSALSPVPCRRRAYHVAPISQRRLAESMLR